MIEAENIDYIPSTVQDIVDNFKSGLEAHFKEAEHSLSDKKLQLNIDMLLKLEEMKKVAVVKAVDNTINKIVGYAAFILDESLVTKVIMASELGLYVSPEYRNMGIAAHLLLVAEIVLREHKVEVIRMVLKDKNQGMHTEIYNLGYDLEELVFHKRI